MAWKTYLWRFKQLKKSEQQADPLSELLGLDLSKGPHKARLSWLVKILGWLKSDSLSQGPSLRISFLKQMLAKHPEWKENFSNNINSIFFHSSFLEFFSRTGLSAEEGLWSDVRSRIFARFLPKSEEDNFCDVIDASFPNFRDTQWLQALSISDLKTLEDLIFLSSKEDDLVSDSSVMAPIRSAIQDAMLLLSTNIAHIGTSVEIRRRLKSASDLPFLSALQTSSFMELSAAVSKLLSGDSIDLPQALSRTREDIKKLTLSMDSAGLSIPLVNKVEVLTAALDRIEELSFFLKASGKNERLEQIQRFFKSAAQASLQSRSLKSHIARHFYLLSRKIAERNGFSGEHYISRSGLEHKNLFVSALGGGVIVVLMTFLKTLYVRMNPAPLILAAGISLIYCIGFLSMQLTGSTLATKLPSFTASHLAGKLKQMRTRDDEHIIRKEIFAIFYSQLIALVGNIAAAAPLVLAFAFFGKRLFGWTLMNSSYADHFLARLNPLIVLPLLLSALTGLELWLSALCGGWFENWFVFTRIPEAISKNEKVLSIVGESKARSLAQWSLRNSSGFAANICLGLFFGFIPLLGNILRIDLNSQHVTISTASALFAVTSVDHPLSVGIWVSTVVGLLLIGVLNFAVSFSLALVVASRAQNVKRIWFLHMVKSFFSSKLN